MCFLSQRNSDRWEFGTTGWIAYPIYAPWDWYVNNIYISRYQNPSCMYTICIQYTIHSIYIIGYESQSTFSAIGLVVLGWIPLVQKFGQNVDPDPQPTSVIGRPSYRLRVALPFVKIFDVISDAVLYSMFTEKLLSNDKNTLV